MDVIKRDTNVMIDPFSKKLYESMDVIFHEKKLFYMPTTDPSLMGKNNEEVINPDSTIHAFIPITIDNC